MKLTEDFNKNIDILKDSLGFGKTYDMLKKDIILGNRKVIFFFIDGFVKDESLQDLITTLSIYKSDNINNAKSVSEIKDTCISAIEVTLEEDLDIIIKAVLSGQTCMVIEGFKECIMLDLRTYPARGPQEPDKEKVLRGARDGFVETIVFNSALIRRRIRDPKLRFEMLTIGEESKTDVAISYIENRVDKKSLDLIKKLLDEIEVDALTLGDQSLIECINKKKWYNTLPKVRYSERPDVTASHLMEGKIVLLVDNNPSALLMPTSIFDFLQDIDDYYSPILTGNYIRFIRNLILIGTLFLTPLYILIVEMGTALPDWLQFMLPTEKYSIPLLIQFLILEVAIDGLRQASLNTPSSLGMSLSVVGALILGEFSVSTGWFIPHSILYMAIVALASFTQQSVELGYAVKFFRIFLLIVTAFFKGPGLIIGIILSIIMIATTKTLTGDPYLYPLIPFNWNALSNVLFRTAIKSRKK
ncbi:spore germination protein [Clostridium paraputrificum]|uniref:spore germination protein n=1 Tax=Clostridium TaxID=1485 RepID=UPI003D34A165